MKRLTVSLCALILGFTLTTTMFLPSTANAVDAKLMGNALELFRELDGIQEVVVQVKKGWLESEAFELSIEITSINEVPGGIWNGSKLISLSSTELFPQDEFRDTVQIRVPWEDPADEVHNTQTYTVTVQVLVPGHIVAESVTVFVCFGSDINDCYIF